jgi:transcriptional regulator with XRE-family HTH domain
MMDPVSVGNQLALMRKRRKMTQSGLSKKTGLSERFISSVETGERLPSWKSLDLMCRVLKADYRVILSPRKNGRG